MKINRNQMFYFRPLLWLLTATGALLLQSFPHSYAAGLKGSKHDLGGLSSSKSAVCVFCHAPDIGSEISDSGETIMPLWNKSLPEIKSFATYDSLGMSGNSGHDSGSVSIACLSCHDGTQAPDINMNQTGRASLLISDGYVGQSDNNRQVHPFSVPYKGNEIDTTDFRVPSKLTINGNPVWWVDSGNNAQVITVGGTSQLTQPGQREKTDIQLYSQSLATNPFQDNINVPFVECASCHNPHTSETSTFLRFDNNQSALCMSCHIK